MSLQKAVPGMPVSAQQFNLLVDAIEALQAIEAGPGLEVLRSPSGKLRVNLTVAAFDALVPVVITAVHGPQPPGPGPAYPDQYTYDVQGVKAAGLVMTHVTPALGRPAVDQEAAIFPAEVGCRAFLIRYRDEAGKVAGSDLWIPGGGKGAAAGSKSGFRGERLAYEECEGTPAEALIDQVLSAMVHAGGGGGGESRIANRESPEGSGPDSPFAIRYSPLPGPEEQPMIINIRQRAFADGYLRLDLEADAFIVDVPPEAVAFSASGSLLAGPGSGGWTWASSGVSVKAVVGSGRAVDFLTARSFAAGGGLVQLDEAELAGVSRLEFRRTGTKESAAGSTAHFGIGFIVTTPTAAGPGNAPPVPTAVPRIVVSGAASAAGPAAPIGD